MKVKKSLLELARREVAEVVRRENRYHYVRSISQPRYVRAVLMRYQHTTHDDDNEEQQQSIATSRIVLETAEKVCMEAGVSSFDERSSLQEGIDILPVELDAEVCGSSCNANSTSTTTIAGGPFYRQFYRFRITLPTTYPDDHPNIKLTSICHHLLVNDETKEVSPIVYTNIVKRSGVIETEDDGTSSSSSRNNNDTGEVNDDGKDEYCLPAVLEALHSFLSEPLAIPSVALQQLSEEEAQRQTDNFR